MGLIRKNGCKLGCIALLSASCSSFQHNLHRIPLPSSGLRWRSMQSVSPKLEPSSIISTRRPLRNLFPFDSSQSSTFPISMSNETSSDSNINGNVNGNESVNGNVDENNNFVQNRTNNIKIEQEDEIDNHIEIREKRIKYAMDISKHYFEEMEVRSGKDYRWIKPLTKPVSHAMRKDFERRKKVYLSDWTDGFKNLKKVIPAVLFLYFACLSPAIR